jgi:transglutaminase-like putative cysteine protease
LGKYTSPSEKIDINDDIKKQAEKLAAGEDDLYVVVFKLADWVNSNIAYNLSSATSEATLPSSWVLANKYGVCDELSNLFISMCRSLGIPARFVSGIA